MSLKAYMLATGKKDADIAAALGLNPEVVRLWRHGRRKIKAERAIALSKVTGIPLHELRPDLWDPPPGAAPPQTPRAAPLPRAKRPAAAPSPKARPKASSDDESEPQGRAA